MSKQGFQRIFTSEQNFKIKSTLSMAHFPKVTFPRLLVVFVLAYIIIHLNSPRPLLGRLTSGFLEREIVPCSPEGRHDQFSPCLKKYVKEKILIPPSGLGFALAASSGKGGKPKKQKHDEKADFLLQHLISKNPSPGFFIECGANDGMFLSPTLKLEREYNWTGILIEGDPTPFEKLVKLHRNAWMMNGALCTTTYSDMVSFYARPFSANGGLRKPAAAHTEVSVPCIPLYTILAALDKTTVDFFSLDVEGAELDILKTVPFDKLIFKVLMVEHAHVPGFQIALVDFLVGNGYKFIGTMLGPGVQDSLFVHKSIYTSDMSLNMKYDPSPTKKPRY